MQCHTIQIVSFNRNLPRKGSPPLLPVSPIQCQLLVAVSAWPTIRWTTIRTSRQPIPNSTNLVFKTSSSLWMLRNRLEPVTQDPNRPSEVNTTKPARDSLIILRISKKVPLWITNSTRNRMISSSIIKRMMRWDSMLSRWQMMLGLSIAKDWYKLKTLLTRCLPHEYKF